MTNSTTINPNIPLQNFNVFECKVGLVPKALQAPSVVTCEYFFVICYFHLCPFICLPPTREVKTNFNYQRWNVMVPAYEVSLDYLTPTSLTINRYFPWLVSLLALWCLWSD